MKPYVKRGKNDAADAEALCEAMSRPTMRFVPVKTAEQQAALMLVGLRDRSTGWNMRRRMPPRRQRTRGLGRAPYRFRYIVPAREGRNRRFRDSTDY